MLHHGARERAVRAAGKRASHARLHTRGTVDPDSRAEARSPLFSVSPMPDE